MRKLKGLLFLFELKQRIKKKTKKFGKIYKTISRVKDAFFNFSATK